MKREEILKELKEEIEFNGNKVNIPIKWVFDEEIKHEFKLLCFIYWSLDANNVCCDSNEYIAAVFNESPGTISKKINKLKRRGYVEIYYDLTEACPINRYISVPKEAL